jgi:hypothetical protein
VPVTAAELDHLLDRGDPVLTAVVRAPEASEDSDDRRRLRAKDIRSEIEDAGLPHDVVESAVSALSRGAASGWQPGHWLGVVADASRITVHPLVDARQEIVSVGGLPRYLPFIRDAHENRRHLVVICDRVGASIARVVRDEVRSVRDVEGDAEHVQKVHSGGFSQRRMQRHSEHTWDQNARKIVEVVASEAEATAAELIVVSGDERAAELVRQHLPERWKDLLVVDDLEPADADDEAYVFDRALTLVRDRAASEIVDLLERYAEARGRGEAADGVEPTFEALQRGAVDVLLVGDDADDEAHFAAEDPRQVAVDVSSLHGLGFRDLRPGRLTDVAVQAALYGDSGVVVCPAHGPDTPDGPVGALLRF